MTAASEQEQALMAELAEQTHEATGQNVTLAFIDRGNTREVPTETARNEIELQVVNHTEAKKAHLLLPPPWVIERSIRWLAAT